MVANFQGGTNQLKDSEAKLKDVSTSIIQLITGLGNMSFYDIQAKLNGIYQVTQGAHSDLSEGIDTIDKTVTVLKEENNPLDSKVYLLDGSQPPLFVDPPYSLRSYGAPTGAEPTNTQAASINMNLFDDTEDESDDLPLSLEI